jgi:alkanesulfonate monooxygenase SsuD/methylene tetrahydromethanopterin reductase-like flavin-dependent oxidoreductase (luciferase family)
MASMHIGYLSAFQNTAGLLRDDEVYAGEVRLADVAVDLGFDSLWVLEHHFCDYVVSPDPLQFLTWMAARHPGVRVGTSVIVLPWYDPVRCTERIVLLDNLSGGRLILGIGRGIARSEYEGLRVDMEGSRERFVAYAKLILEGLETGFVEADNEFIHQPRCEIRPRPQFSFRGRSYAAAMSPESIPIMAELGVGVFVIPQKPWPTVRQDFDDYEAAWRSVHGSGSPPPPPLASGQVFVHPDGKRAEELAFRHIGQYYRTVMDHYGFAKHAHEGVKDYEFYERISSYIDRHGSEGAVADFVRLMPWGTPDQVLEKLVFMRDYLGIAGFQANFSVGGLPYEEAETSLRLFAREVLPVVHSWATEPIPYGAPLNLAQPFASG